MNYDATCIDCETFEEFDPDFLGAMDAWQFDLEGARCPECLALDA